MSMEDVEIKKWTYYDKYKGNYGANAQAVQIGALTLFFSYETVIGFRWNGNSYYTSEKYSATTAKHLKFLCPDKSRRLKEDVFQKLLQTALNDFKWQRVLGD